MTRQVARRAPGRTPDRGGAWQQLPRNRRVRPRRGCNFYVWLADACERSWPWIGVGLLTAIMVLGMVVWSAAARADGEGTAERQDRPLFDEPQATSAHLDTTVDADPVPETREERLQRLIWQDAETASRLVPSITNYAPRIRDGLVYDIALAVARSSRQHELRPELVLALIEVESHFDPEASSSTSDHGLCQVHCIPEYDVQRNVELGCSELAMWLRTARGDERLALCRYNGGGRGERIARCRAYANRVLRLAGDGE